MPTKHLMLVLALMMLPSSARAEYFPDTPMPNRPGCRLMYCVPLWDGHRHGRRCFWRCPRLRPSPPPSAEPADPPPSTPPIYDRAPPPRVDVASTLQSLPPFALLAILVGIFGFVAVTLLARPQSADFRRETDDALSEAAEAAAAKAKLDEAVRDAENLVKRHADRAYRRGRHAPLGDLE